MKSSKTQPLNLNQFNNLLQQSKVIDCTYPLAALVWMPYGYKILNLTENFLNGLFEKYGYERHIFPYLVSSCEFDRINKQISSFEKGVFRVTDSITLRPSGESAIYPMFRRWIKSEHDLPKKVFQIGSMFRKGSTRGFMRPNENDFFVEAHSAFSSRKEAEIEFTNSNSLVEEYLRWLAIPTLKTIRPPWTNKPVAEKEYAFDALLPTGETSLLNVTYSQMQIFSKAFDISFTKTKGIKDYTYQTEFGFSQRSILTSVWLLSSQDKLFLLPPYSPIQVAIIQIDTENSKLSEYSEKVLELLKLKNIRALVDREKGQLFKRFSKFEKIGVPIRLEIGENELKSCTIKLVRQDNGDKADYSFDNIDQIINQTFEKIISDAYDTNEKKLTENIVVCNNKEKVRKTIESGKIAKVQLCNHEDCVKELQVEIGLGEVIGFQHEDAKIDDPCVNCYKLTSAVAFYARRV